MSIDYDRVCKCEHMPANHAAEVSRGELRRMSCLLCDCPRYRPSYTFKAKQSRKGTSKVGGRA